MTIYEDDGKSYDFEQGAFRQRKINVDGQGNIKAEVVTGDGPALFGKAECVRQMTRPGD